MKTQGSELFRQHRNESSLSNVLVSRFCEIMPARAPRFSGADLVDLPRTLPKPDEEYPTIVETLLEKQPVVKVRMATLIDTSVLIAAERGDLDLSNVLARYAEEDVAISAIIA